MGSEPGMGWNWITSLAKTGEVELFVISEGEYRSQIEDYLQSEKIKVNSEEFTSDSPKLWVNRIHFYWNPVSQSTRDKCWNQGNWLFYPLYEKWQKKTADIAREIIKKVGESGDRIDVLHQLNMIGFREPGYLWEVSKETGIPFIWGPVDAKDKFPMAYTDGASLKTKAFLLLKNIISIYQLKYSRRVRMAAKQASVLLGASSNSVRSFKKYMDLDAVLMNETGCSLVPQGTNVREKKGEGKDTLNILWVGKMDFRKQLGLAIESIARTKGKGINLHVVGGGNDTAYRVMSEKLMIKSKVIWHGAVSHDEVQQLMRKCDLMLFTSVAEGTPHVVLEAIANGLPVICHDTCGHGDSITDDIGKKIPLSNPTKSAKGFAEIIDWLNNNYDELEMYSANCKQRTLELSWDNKAMRMVELYKKAVK